MSEALSVAASLIFVVFLVPPALYGTSVEAIEGRVLVVVETLQELLDHGDMQFSEAVYFQVRDALRQAYLKAGVLVDDPDCRADAVWGKVCPG